VIREPSAAVSSWKHLETAHSTPSNQANRLTGLVDSDGSGPFWSYSHGRDDAGRLGTSSDPLDGGQHTYGDDALNRLASRPQTGGRAVEGDWGGRYEVGVRVVI
jgi:hypothetical protein